MQIIHSPRTCVVDPAASSVEAAGDMAGALYIEPPRSKERPFYQKLPVTQISQIIDSRNPEKHILADFPEQVMAELSRRYPPPRPEVSYILPADHVSISWERTDDDYYRHRSEWTTKRFSDVWVILDRPLVSTTISSLAELKALSIALGPLLVESGAVNRLFPHGYLRTGHTNLEYAANLEGFVVTPRTYGLMDLELYQVNYNPRAIAFKSFRQRKTKVETRLVEDFPDDVYFALYKTIRPDEWPSKHPFYHVAYGKDLTYQKAHGWGHRDVNQTFNENSIMRALQLSLKLWPGHKWWRESGHDFGEAVCKALPFIHGVERFLCKQQASWERQIAGWYEATLQGPRRYYASGDTSEEYLDNQAEQQWNDESPHPVDRDPPTFDQFRAGYPRMENHREIVRQALCRWLRQEARALKIPLPPPPKLPVWRKKKKGARRRAPQTPKTVLHELEAALAS